MRKDMVHNNAKHEKLSAKIGEVSKQLTQQVTDLAEGNKIPPNN